MPSNLLTTDTSFPQFRNGQSDGEKIQVIMNYLFMLREQLRYSMANMGVNNFNDAELDDMKKIFLEDAEGNIGQLQMTAEELNIRFENVEGDISALTQTASKIETRVQDAEGDISTLAQTASEITSRVEDAEGSISALTQTASEITSRVEDAEGNISALTQTASEITSRVEDAEGSISTLSQKVDSFTLDVRNGETSSTIKLMAGKTTISSKEITLTGLVNFVTEDQLAGNGTTTINGGNITTGKITAIDFEGCVFRTVLKENGMVGGEIEMYYADKLAGGIRLDDQGADTEYAAAKRMWIYTQTAGGHNFAMKLESTGGMSMEALGNVYIEGGTYVDIHAATNVYIKGGNMITLNCAKIKLEGEVYVNGKLIS